MKEILIVRVKSKIYLTARVFFRLLDNRAGDEAGAAVEEWPFRATLSALNKIHVLEHK